MERHVRITKPVYAREFLLIILDALSPRGRDDVPQRYVNVAGSETDGPSACEHQRFSDVVFRNKAEFLAQLARYRFSGVFLRLNVTSWWEPELRIFVIYEQDVVSINYGKV